MEGKDAEEVVQFMELFQRLRNWVDDEPEGLEELAERDESVNQLCLDLYNSALWLEIAEESRHRFAAPVDPKFVTVWRNFEDRFADSIDRVFLRNQGFDLRGYKADKKSRRDILWKLADENARDSARAIQSTINHLYETVSDGDARYPDDFVDIVKKAFIAWHKLRAEIGFDVQSTLRRRALSPFVLVPRHVAKQYGVGEKLSLFDHLSQAYDAFILGVPFAALALMRSILEVTLRDHYGAQGNINEMIDNAQKLPQACQKAALHRLRQLSNDVLHFKNSAKTGPRDWERELLYFLVILRALIEGAPASNLSAFS